MKIYNHIKIFTTDSKEWKEVLKDFPDIDLYYFPEYVSIYEKLYKGKGFLIYYEKDDKKVISTFIKRKIEETDFYDITTPYGCGGLFYNNKKKLSSLCSHVYTVFNNYFLKEKIISEFTRVHPLFYNEEIILNNFHPHLVTYSVFIDLKKTIREIEKDFRKGHKSAIKKALREGVEIKISREEKHIELFHRIYTDTMKRKGAGEFYLFPLEFIKDFFLKFKHSYIFLAIYKSQPVSASMFLGGTKIFHYYLSGSLRGYENLNSTHFIIYNAIKFAQELGFSIFHLGGGIRGKDFLFLFKSGFSKWHLPYYVYGVVHNREIYDNLVKERMGKGPLPNDFYFPVYRAPLL